MSVTLAIPRFLKNKTMEKTKETKPVSFRLPVEVFDTLQDKGQEMDLSAHELACKIVQENYQVSNDAIPMKDTVTNSKQIFLPPPSKQVFHFNLKELKSVYYTLTGSKYLPSHVQTIRIGIDECRGLMKIGEDLWEIVVSHSNEQSNGRDTWKY